MQKVCSEAVIKALMVVIELTQARLSETAVDVLVADLAEYPEGMVLRALEKCRREVKPGRFCLAEVIERMDDGHPGVEQAWGMVSKAVDESQSILWTRQMAEAYRAAMPMMLEGDMVAARMAFKEAYSVSLDEARLHRVLPDWTVSLGTDKAAAQAVLEQAEQMGRLTREQRLALAPPTELDDKRAVGMAGGVSSLVLTHQPAAEGPGRQRARQLLAEVVQQMTAPIPDEPPAHVVMTEQRKAEAASRVAAYEAQQGEAHAHDHAHG